MCVCARGRSSSGSGEQLCAVVTKDAKVVLKDLVRLLSDYKVCSCDSTHNTQHTTHRIHDAADNAPQTTCSRQDNPQQTTQPHYHAYCQMPLHHERLSMPLLPTLSGSTRSRSSVPRACVCVHAYTTLCVWVHGSAPRLGARTRLTTDGMRAGLGTVASGLDFEAGEEPRAL
jgi:hypothetical protein